MENVTVTVFGCQYFHFGGEVGQESWAGVVGWRRDRKREQGIDMLHVFETFI